MKYSNGKIKWKKKRKKKKIMGSIAGLCRAGQMKPLEQSNIRKKNFLLTRCFDLIIDIKLVSSTFYSDILNREWVEKITKMNESNNPVTTQEDENEEIEINQTEMIQ